MILSRCPTYITHTLRHALSTLRQSTPTGLDPSSAMTDSTSKIIPPTKNKKPKERGYTRYQAVPFSLKRGLAVVAVSLQPHS